MLYKRGAKHQSDARPRPSPLPPRAALTWRLDGDELSDIMLDYQVGVSVRETLTLVSIDSDFSEDDYDTLG